MYIQTACKEVGEELAEALLLHDNEYGEEHDEADQIWRLKPGESAQVVVWKPDRLFLLKLVASEGQGEYKSANGEEYIYADVPIG